MTNIDLPPFLNTGIHTVVIAIIAILYGTVMERFFVNKPDMWIIGQLMLVGIGYDFIREYYNPDPDAWVVFASCVFFAQPTLLPRLKRMLKLQ